MQGSATRLSLANCTVFPIGGSFPIRPRDGHCVWFFSHTIHLYSSFPFLGSSSLTHRKLNATFIFSCILFLGLIWRLDFPCILRIINAPLVFYDLNFFLPLLLVSFSSLSCTRSIHICFHILFIFIHFVSFLFFQRAESFLFISPRLVSTIRTLSSRDLAYLLYMGYL